MKILILKFAIIVLAAGCGTGSNIPFSYLNVKEAVGKNGAVASAHPLASEVGINVLKDGGNAIDAAIAIQFALAVVYPQAGNIGGGGFLVYREKNGNAYTLDYREKAPAKATENMFLDSEGQVVADRSRYGVLAGGVPGTVAGMWDAHQRFGKLSWKDLLVPAIRLAKKGYRITEREARQLNTERPNFKRENSGFSPVFVKENDWKPGDWLVQPDLARTLEAIANRGADGFYRGPIAFRFAEEIQRRGGLITVADLENYQTVWRTPFVFEFQGLRIITMPPPSSGGILLQQMLGMVDSNSSLKKGFHSTEAVHLMVEAERRAFADRAVHHGDPDFWKVPTAKLVEKKYLERRMADFDPLRATPSSAIEAGSFSESEETTHYSVVDAAGNAVAVTTTLNDSYGSRVVVQSAGFILNNEMDDFSAKPGAPNLYGAIGGKANAVAPEKRPLSSMTPTIVERASQPWLIVGSPGGTTIPTTVFQILLDVSAFNMSLPDAVRAGRFHHQWKPDAIQIEPGGLPEDVQQQLKQYGHIINTRSSPIGRVEAIIRLSDGRWQAVADNRGDDSAKAY